MSALLREYAENYAYLLLYGSCLNHEINLEYPSLLGCYAMTTAIYTCIDRSTSYICNKPQELELPQQRC